MCTKMEEREWGKEEFVSEGEISDGHLHMERWGNCISFKIMHLYFT